MNKLTCFFLLHLCEEGSKIGDEYKIMRKREGNPMAREIKIDA